jgi:hypothetical protein
MNELGLKPQLNADQTALIMHFEGDIDLIEPAQKRFEGLHYVKILSIEEEIK